MGTKEDRWYRSGEFKQEVFDEDLENIVNYYRKKGYIDAKILGFDISYDELFDRKLERERRERKRIEERGSIVTNRKPE